jgi:anti-sigma-K factor RskA
LKNPGVRVTTLGGTEKSPKSSGKILWDPKEKRAFFYATHLPAVPAGKTYQLWIIAGNKPFDAGIFSVDQDGNGFLKVDSLSEADKAQKFAVTLEPAGGVPQPTGEMHLLGSL